MTDSATVHRWIQLTLTKEQRVKTKGAAEIMVKRRLGVLRSLVDEGRAKNYCNAGANTEEQVRCFDESQEELAKRSSA